MSDVEHEPSIIQIWEKLDANDKDKLAELTGIDTAQLVLTRCSTVVIKLLGIIQYQSAKTKADNEQRVAIDKYKAQLQLEHQMLEHATKISQQQGVGHDAEFIKLTMQKLVAQMENRTADMFNLERAANARAAQVRQGRAQDAMIAASMKRPGPFGR